MSRVLKVTWWSLSDTRGRSVRTVILYDLGGISYKTKTTFAS